MPRSKPFQKGLRNQGQGFTDRRSIPDEAKTILRELTRLEFRSGCARILDYPEGKLGDIWMV